MLAQAKAQGYGVGVSRYVDHLEGKITPQTHNDMYATDAREPRDSLDESRKWWVFRSMDADISIVITRVLMDVAISITIFV